MKYYILEFRLLPSGDFHLGVTPEYNVDYLHFNEQKFGSPAMDFHFSIEKTIPLVDVMSQAVLGTSGFVISEEFRRSLSLFRMATHKLFQVNIHGQTVNQPYYWLHFIDTDIHKHIDYTASSFHKTMYTSKRNRININSFEDYEKKREELIKLDFGWDIDVYEIVFQQDFVVPYDIFRIGYFDHRTYISERLKAYIEEKGFQALEIFDAKNLIFTN